MHERALDPPEDTLRYRDTRDLCTSLSADHAQTFNPQYNQVTNLLFFLLRVYFRVWQLSLWWIRLAVQMGRIQHNHSAYQKVQRQFEIENVDRRDTRENDRDGCSKALEDIVGVLDDHRDNQATEGLT
jgi:hypothetical protein